MKHYIFRLVDVPQMMASPKGLKQEEGEDQLVDGFTSKDLAEKWINESGQRQVDYVILQIFRKP
jgi:hypothetical protein